MKTLRLGVIGLGAGAADLLLSPEDLSLAEITAGADISPIQRARFAQMYPGVRTHADAEALCADPNVDVVWVSSPNHLHAEHTIAAARHNKHVIVEKPMAITLDEAAAMVDAAERAGIKLVAGHTPSFSMAYRMMRKLIAEQRYGELRALTLLAYSDWILRPRTPDELDVQRGGGVLFRQAPHQMDAVRFLGGGLLRSVRGMTGSWLRERTIPGYFGAYLEFENATPALICHNAYGYFMSNELVPWGTDRFFYDAQERAEVRTALRNGTRNEGADKEELRLGGDRGRRTYGTEIYEQWVPGDNGFLIVSCDRADLRHSPHGIFVHSDAGKHDVPLSGGPSRRAELEELHRALETGSPLCHDGRWGMANLEASLALVTSAQERKEIYLRHQVPIAAGYDAELEAPRLAS